jgi:hypothetical protein
VHRDEAVVADLNAADFVGLDAPPCQTLPAGTILAGRYRIDALFDVPPEAFDPQHLAVPSPSCAQVWLLPPEMATAPEVKPETCVGTFLFEEVPSPSCP